MWNDPSNKNIQITNLPKNTQKLVIDDMCCKYGRIMGIVTRGSRGYIVAYDSHADAEFALYRLNGMIFQGNTLRVIWGPSDNFQRSALERKKNAQVDKQLREKRKANSPKSQKKVGLSLRTLTPLNPVVDNVAAIAEQASVEVAQVEDNPALESNTNTNESSNTAKGNAKICPFFAKGFCKKGDECNMSHINPRGAPRNVNKNSNFTVRHNENRTNNQLPNTQQDRISAPTSTWKDRILQGNREREEKERKEAEQKAAMQQRLAAERVERERVAKEQQAKIDALVKENPNYLWESISFPLGLSQCNVPPEKLRSTANSANNVSILLKSSDVLREILGHLDVRDRIHLRTCSKALIAQCWEWRPRECPAELVQARASSGDDGGYAYWKLGLKLNVKREIRKENLLILYYVLGPWYEYDEDVAKNQLNDPAKPKMLNTSKPVKKVVHLKNLKEVHKFYNLHCPAPSFTFQWHYLDGRYNCYGAVQQKRPEHRRVHDEYYKYSRNIPRVHILKQVPWIESSWLVDQDTADRKREEFRERDEKIAEAKLNAGQEELDLEKERERHFVYDVMGVTSETPEWEVESIRQVYQREKRLDHLRTYFPKTMKGPVEYQSHVDFLPEILSKEEYRLKFEDERYWGFPGNEGRVSVLNIEQFEVPTGQLEVRLMYIDTFGEILSNPLNVNVPDGYSPMDGDYRYCLHGSGDVHMADGSFKKVSELRVGDEVLTKVDNLSASARVLARTINRIARDADNSELFSFVKVGEAIVTPNHPVRLVNSQQRRVWVRPQQIAAPFVLPECEEVYNFVLESRTSLFVNGTEVSTLGQFCDGIDDENSYFGSERVVEQLQSMKGFPDVVFVGKEGFESTDQHGAIP